MSEGRVNQAAQTSRVYHDEQTSDKIELPSELMALLEPMAKHVHDRWMSERIANGWCFGKVYSIDQKTHPCIIPYEDLSESEKDLDRHTAIQTIKFIMSSGYSIVR